MADQSQVFRRMKIKHQPLRLLAVLVIWLASFMTCCLMMAATACITAGTVLAMFGWAFAVYVFEAPSNLIQSLRNNL